MSEKVYYEYWDEDDDKRPKEIPKNCETFYGGCWEKELHLTVRWRNPRRWPVPEYVWRTNRYCEAFGISVPDGYEIIGFGVVRRAKEYFLSHFGKAHRCAIAHPQPVLNKIDEWITPIDDEAKLRPVCEVRNVDEDWNVNNYILLAYYDGFYVVYNDQDITTWDECRVEKSEIERLRKGEGGE